MNRVVVTGIGPMSSLGTGCRETWDSVLNSRPNLVKERYSIDGEEWGSFYLHKMRHFDIKDFDIPRSNFKYIKEMRTVKEEDTDLYYLLAVIKKAIEDSGLEYDPAHNDIGLVITHENPGIEIFFEELIDSAYEVFKSGKKMSKMELARALYNKNCQERGYNLQTFSYLFAAAKVFDIHGYSLFLNNACASGLFAIESACRQISTGASPAVIVAAVDDPTRIYKYLWFKEKGLYSEDGITRPFSEDADGIVFGDGGVALMLEDLECARHRNARIYAEYLGGGFSLEGWKITVPNITDDFYVRSFEKALTAARVDPEEIDLVNPHGVGMKITDRYEADTVNRVFKNSRPPVSAFKPLVGHNLGGSALLETAITLLSLEHGLIPATLNCERPNKNLNLDIVRENREARLMTVAKMSCGFAGFSGVGIFRKIEEGAGR